jgi:DNA-binding response OmpR family regulator
VNERILIVDDEINIRLMLRTILEADYSIEEASNGQEALEKLRRTPFDLVILDLNMPVLDGMSVLEELKRTPAANMPRFIVLTAYGSIPAAVKATRLGALDFLEKPASPEELRETVKAVLREPQPARQETADETSDGYEGVLNHARRALRMSDYATAESMMMKAADLAHNDAAYFNLLGVIYEARHQWRLAKKFYGKAVATDKKYEPAQRNLRRLYELNTFGKSVEPVAFGDEPDVWLAKFMSKK